MLVKITFIAAGVVVIGILAAVAALFWASGEIAAIEAGAEGKEDIN